MSFIGVSVSLTLLVSKFRENLFRGLKSICQIFSKSSNSNIFASHDSNNNYQLSYKNDAFGWDKIFLADSPEKCEYAVQCLLRNLSDGVLGMDCEWVNEGRVSLLQVATNNGICVLFRLKKIGFVPLELQDLLGNRGILKVGVATYEDGKKLDQDYGCLVSGTVDLRTLANRLNLPNRQSLAALCIEYLGVSMDKLTEVRCSNWDAEMLDNEQIKYAAFDAIASVRIYHAMRKQEQKRQSFWKRVAELIKRTWGRSTGVLIHHLPQGVLDTKFRGVSESPRIATSSPKVPGQIQKFNISPKINSIPTRKEPLYHNCYLQAPDGETLCTCDRKKAEWYINKDLGTQVNDSPLTVRLNFEPSGRACGAVGQYYTQIKLNQCVVCGAQDKFIKKNVVPREYRKYFPLVMKAHQSHDVLLLCPYCHEISNMNDIELRKQLEIMCNAPITRLSCSTPEQQQKQKKLRSAVNALNAKNSFLPPQRRRELESVVREFTGENKILKEHLAEIFNEKIMDSPPVNHDSRHTHQKMKCIPHGLKVVQYFSNTERGLVTLERTWREHFLTTMKPRYLPKLWSVRHNQERLEIRQIQNRIEPKDAEIAGLKIEKSMEKWSNEVV